MPTQSSRALSRRIPVYYVVLDDAGEELAGEVFDRREALALAAQHQGACVWAIGTMQGIGCLVRWELS